MSNNDKYITERQILWKVSNITRNTLKNYVYIHSKSFNINCGPCTTEWDLMMDISDMNIGMFLHNRKLEFINLQKFDVNVLMEIIGSDNLIIKSYEDNLKLNDLLPGGNGHDFATINEILDNNNKYLTDGNTLIFSIKQRVEYKRDNLKIQMVNDQLLNYSKLLNSMKFSDFTLVSSDNIEIPVHRAILITQSPIFEKMFESSFNDVKTKKAAIDLDISTLFEMLRYIYTGQVENLNDRASVLIIVADKYEIAGLKTLCILSLLENLTIVNVFDVLNYAKKIYEKTLYHECMQFILKNYYNFNKVDWMKLDFNLMLNVMNSFEQASNQVIIFHNSL